MNDRSAGSLSKIPPEQLAFDIDGVFADTFRVFVERARTLYGMTFEYEDITEYDFRSVLDIEERVSEELIRSILDFPVEVGIRPITGAVEVLTQLSRLGPLLFVTARPGKEAILRWACKHLSGVNRDLITVEATGAHEEKLPILLRRGVKYFVEDCLETCHILDKASITPIVFEQPWNKKPHPFPTVKDWDELSAIIHWQAPV